MAQTESKKIEMVQTESKIIPLEELLRKGVCYEDIQDFRESIFKDVYGRAKEAVRQIVEGNEELKQRRKASGRMKMNTEIANVVSFIGRRGTGKSSSMLSFQEALSQHANDRYGESLFQEEADMNDVRFFSLDCIDAAALEEAESVFTLVLAQMLSSIIELEDNELDEMGLYPKRSLMQNLGDIYEDYNSLKELDNSGQKRDYSAIENLRHAASSQRIRASFEKLVFKYLQFMGQVKDNNKTRKFLVIAIDDLDMSHYNERISTHRQINIRSYDIMRDISKYFSVPGVIVLVAYNHTNLQQQVCGFFMSGNAGFYNEVKEVKSILRSGETLASEFMEKVFTLAYRIYMPSWRKEDYNTQSFHISIGMAEMLDDIFACFRKEKRYEFSIKELILILFAQKTGIYYDNLGHKRHFLEPDSLRGLNNLLCLLVGQNVVSINGQNQLCIKNDTDTKCEFKRIMDDVYFRFIHEKLYLEEEKILLNDLLECRIDLRSESIVNRIAPLIESLGRMNKQFIRLYQEAKLRGGNVKEIDQIIESRKRNDKVRYSYAELVHCIYHMTRDNIYTKEFVACILHSYSVHLTQIYKQYKEEKNKFFADKESRLEYIDWYRYPDNRDLDNCKYDKIKGKYQLLKGVIGNTVLGGWAEYFMPKFYINDGGPERAGVVSCIVGLRGTEFKGIFDIEDEDTDINWMIYKCIYLMSMYPDILQWRKLEVQFPKRKDKVKQVAIQHDGKEVEFEPAAFIKFSILYTEYLPKMETLFLEAFQETENDDELEKDFKEKVRKRVCRIFEFLWIWHCNWDAKYGNMILPFYSVDLMYNMIKHLFQKGKIQKEYVLNLKNEKVFLEEFWNMILDFKKYLKKIDQFYCLDNENSLSETFFQSPYIRFLEFVRKEPRFASFIGKYIHGIMTAVFNGLNYRLSADENGMVEVIW